MGQKTTIRDYKSKLNKIFTNKNQKKMEMFQFNSGHSHDANYLLTS